MGPSRTGKRAAAGGRVLFRIIFRACAGDGCLGEAHSDSGGIENQQDYTEYARFIQDNPKVKVAVTLFQCRKQIADSIRKYVSRPDFELIEADNLRDGVTRAFEKIKAAGGSLVLFSPTAPSFGYYKNFMERGDDFINIVKSLHQ